MSHGVNKRGLTANGRCNGSLSQSTRGHGKAKSKYGVAAAVTQRKKKDVHATVGDINEAEKEAQRQSLLVEKQAQLEEVVERHDTLVREVFHMENFRMMLAFDPEEAKSENSKVFQEYKSQYDLLEETEPTSSPARKTRRAQTERRQSITTPSISAPAAPSRQNARSPKTSRTSTKLWEIIAHEREKGKPKIDKGKAKETRSEIFSDQNEESEQRPADSISLRARRTRQSKADTISADVSKHREGDVLGINGKHKLTAKPSKLLRPSVPQRRSDRQKALIDSAATTQHQRASEGTAPQQRDVLPLTPSKRSAEDDPVEQPKLKLKRIKLIVRRPPPLISHPAQRPPQPKSGSSLHVFLSSTSERVDEAALEHQIHKEATLWERAYKLRQEGRFLPSSEKVTTESLAELRASSFTPPRTFKDMWDHVVESVTTYGRVRKTAIGQQIASQIAIKIRAYWDAQEAKKEKAKAITEKQLRVLARDTIRMVISEWKKAVFHIREKKRLMMEEEERRRGHEHLDAILNQSGHILKTQHGNLLRGGVVRSRSHSVVASAFSEDEEDDDVGAAQDTDRESIEGTDGAEEQEERFEAEEEDWDEVLPAVSAAISEANQDDGMEEADDEDDGFNTRLLLGDGLLTDSPEQEAASASPEEHLLDTLPEQDSSSRQTSPSVATPCLLTEGVDDGIQSSLGVYSEDAVGEPGTPAEDMVFPPSKLSSPGPQPSLDTITKINVDLNLPVSREQKDETAPVAEGIVVSESVTQEQEGVSQNDRAKDSDDEDDDEDSRIPAYLRPYAVVPVDWESNNRITPPLLLRGVLRPYQQGGLEWLATLHSNHLNGILADEMGLGKTIQTIALLAHLACDRGIWGPHLIIVPTSVLLNWEMEFKKFLPGFKTLSYHGSTKRRKELRQGWNDKHRFNVCITSYTLASRDAHIFKRRPWYYMVLDEAHMIKNFKSNRWNTLLMFRSFRRLLLTGTPLQNNLTELWALLKFLMSGANFANLKEFGEWFSNPLEKAIEMGNVHDDETMQRVSKLHTVLRPYLLRRLKRDVEKELPSKYEHLVLCPLSKRQRFLYDEFMSRATTRDALQSGVYQKIANVLMQLRKVCNHPDLFEVRPVVTSFAMPRSSIADFEIKELLLRRRLLHDQEERVNLDLLGLQFIQRQNTPLMVATETKRLDATPHLMDLADIPGEAPPKDMRTIAAYRKYTAYMRYVEEATRWGYLGYLNRHRCNRCPIYSLELVATVRRLYQPIHLISAIDLRHKFMETSSYLNSAVLPYTAREGIMADCIDRFAVITPAVVARDLPRIALSGYEEAIKSQPMEFDQILHRASVKLQIAFPDPSLLQYDCGKLQQLAHLLREKKAGGHRALIFTQMTRILDLLEIFLNFHGYLYLRLDGATKIEDRQYITERFNADERVFCFISSSRSGGVGINLTGADTVIFYDSDFNPQMDRQCEDRAHRIGQIRDVHIYRFISQHTVEEAMLRKANQKRSLDDLVIQKGEFDWRSLFNDEGALTKALEEFEDTEDVQAAALAAREEDVMGDADEADFADDAGNAGTELTELPQATQELQHETIEGEDDTEEGGTVVDYMVMFVEKDYDFFRDWRL